MTISIDQPHNPMVNSGAIMSASILLHMVKKEMNMAQKYDYVLDFFRVIFFVQKKRLDFFLRFTISKIYLLK